MITYNIVCYQCNQSSSSYEEVVLCPSCSSEFIEITENASQQSEVVDSPFQNFNHPLEQTENNRNNRNNSLDNQQVYTTSSGQVIQIFSTIFNGLENRLSPGTGSQNQNNLFSELQGFFINGFWPIDQIVSQIMEEYEPHTTPTDQDYIKKIPCLKVRKCNQIISGEESFEPQKQIQIDQTEHLQQQQQDGYAHAKEGDPCSVCWDGFKKEEKVLELLCKHAFHKNCLLPWLDRNNTCPVCRAPLPGSSTESTNTLLNENQSDDEFSDYSRSISENETEGAAQVQNQPHVRTTANGTTQIPVSQHITNTSLTNSPEVAIEDIDMNIQNNNIVNQSVDQEACNQNISGIQQPQETSLGGRNDSMQADVGNIQKNVAQSDSQAFQSLQQQQQVPQQQQIQKQLSKKVSVDNQVNNKQ